MSGFANELNISNDVQGIGLGMFDNSALYGSGGVLESRCNMNRLGVWNANPNARVFGKGNNFLTIMGQEAGHRWGAFINFQDSTGAPSNLILGRSDAHWSYFFDVDHSSLEGGNWDFQSPQIYICPTSIDFFSQLDEYIFGLRTPNEVAPMFYVASPTNDLPQNRSVGTPMVNSFAFGNPVPVTIDDIIAAEGPRLPAVPDEEKHLRQAFVLLHQNGTTPTGAELNKIATFRRAWEDYFEQSVDGRFAVNTSITQTYPVGLLRGRVKDMVTKEALDVAIVQSQERGFEQFLPTGGDYVFRYMANENSGATETATVAAAVPGYWPRMIQVEVPYGGEVQVDLELIAIATGIEETPLPGSTTLYPNYPNPFNPETLIRYSIPRPGNVFAAVYDARGGLVKTLVNRTMIKGEHEVAWDGRDERGIEVGSGVYFVRLVAGDGVRSRKIVLLK
jgi:hypothetical protein